jgi:hypothetical protein
MNMKNNHRKSTIRVPMTTRTSTITTHRVGLPIHTGARAGADCWRDPNGECYRDRMGNVIEF